MKGMKLHPEPYRGDVIKYHQIPIGRTTFDFQIGDGDGGLMSKGEVAPLIQTSDRETYQQNKNHCRLK